MSIVLTLTILGLALVGFVTEWLPVELTAITVAVLLMLLGLVTPEEGISGFGNAATITVMAMFILSGGITRTGVIQVVRDWLMKWGGNNISQQIFVMGGIVGAISGFINNTAVVAVFIPIVEEWCKKQGISVSKLLIPLSYSAVLGGTLTLIGTSTNILASGLSNQLGYGELTLFQFTPIGLVTFALGLIYICLIAPRIIPSRKAPKRDIVGQEYELKDYVSEIVITPRSSLIGQTLRESEIQRKFDFDVLEIIHDNTRFPQPLADKKLSAGDILLVRGSGEDLLKIKDERGIDILADVKFGQNSLEAELSAGEETVAEVLILSNSSLVGSTLKDWRFRQRYNVTVLAIRRGQELVRELLGRVPLRFGDLLLVQGPKESILGLQTAQDLLVIEQRDMETLRQDKAWIAIAIILGVILVAAITSVPILVSALAGVVLMVATGCLKPGEVYSSVRWDVIFLLAGLIPLGIAMQNSGTTEWLANNFVAIGGNLSGYWILFFFYIVTSLLTEILSNNASVVLMIPVAAQVATTLELNPIAFIFAVTFAASNSYMTPIGYQTNTMVYGAGGYRFLDFTRVGAPLSLLLTLVTPLVIVLVYGL
ncbi:MAG: SLC13 family permease [Chroococcales cyanobacterium]